MKSIILSVRFLLEVVIVLGIASGVYFEKGIVDKFLYLLTAIIIVVVWSRYGAPSSPSVLTGINKLILEIVVYGIGIFAFYNLFGLNIGSIYTVIAVGDLVLMYAFKLQGN